MSKHMVGFVLGILTAGCCWAQEHPLFFTETSRLDQLSAVARMNTQTGTVALELLELVALGKTSVVRPGTELSVGLAPGELRLPTFATPSVRLYAIRKIGDCGRPEALQFLKGLTRLDFADDPTQTIWPNVRVSLSIAILNGIDDRQARIEFLERALADEGDGRSLLAFWAANALCDQGAAPALPRIRQSFRSAWTGQRGEEAIISCEAKIQVLSRNPDRITALASVLALDTEVPDDILQWAVYQLDSMRSPTADAELDRFADEIGRAREGSLQHERFWLIREDLSRLRKRRLNGVRR